MFWKLRNIKIQLCALTQEEKHSYIETQIGNGDENNTFDLTTNSLNINPQKLEIKLEKPSNETIKTQWTVPALSTSSWTGSVTLLPKKFTLSSNMLLWLAEGFQEQ